MAEKKFVSDYPELMKEWHPTKNGDFDPKKIGRGSATKIFWKCLVCAHVWNCSPNARTSPRASAGTGSCVKCRERQKKRVSDNPDILKDWSPLNKQNPYEVAESSCEKVMWLCNTCGWEWSSSPNVRTRQNRGCKKCAAKIRGAILQRPKQGNSLQERHPERAKNFDDEKNYPLTPYDICSRSHLRCAWKCKENENHKWEISPSNYRNGCPFCNERTGATIDKLRHFVKYVILPNIDLFDPAVLNVMMHDAGFAGARKSKALVKEIQSGKFPKKELEKFANGEASIADGLLEASDNDKDEDEKRLKIHEVGKPIQKEALEDEPVKSVSEVLQSAEGTKIEYLTDLSMKFVKCKFKADLWTAALENEALAVRQVESDKRGTEFVQELRTEFLREYRECRKMKLPAGYTFDCDPNLMQLYIATQVRDQKRMGNFSTGGAGKTLSAVLASRVCKLKDRLTVILCVNSTIGEWGEKLKLYFANSRVYTKTDNLEVKGHTYLLLNYEYLQGPNREQYVENILKYDIGMVIIDEIQEVKQRADIITKRREMTLRLLTRAADKDPDLRVLGMSGTPVINALKEGKSLLEMILGLHLDDLKEFPNRTNAMNMYRVFVSSGFRWKIKNDSTVVSKEIRIDCTDRTEELMAAKGSTLKWETILTEVRLPTILENIKRRGKTMIYTHYVTGIVELLKEAIEEEGYSVAVFIGGDEEDKRQGFNDFVEGNAQVLIASSCVGTGLDRLQHVCSRLIFNTLPWTHALRQQIVWRLARQGQTAKKVDVIYPITYGYSAGEEWSYCQAKLDTLNYKRSLADACVDGVIPDEEMPNEAKIRSHFQNYLNRPEALAERTVNRRKMKVALRRR